LIKKLTRGQGLCRVRLKTASPPASFPYYTSIIQSRPENYKQKISLCPQNQQTQKLGLLPVYLIFYNFSTTSLA
jgi:hypothetical protein